MPPTPITTAQILGNVTAGRAALVYDDSGDDDDDDGNHSHSHSHSHLATPTRALPQSRARPTRIARSQASSRSHSHSQSHSQPRSRRSDAEARRERDKPASAASGSSAAGSSSSSVVAVSGPALVISPYKTRRIRAKAALKRASTGGLPSPDDNEDALPATRTVARPGRHVLGRLYAPLSEKDRRHSTPLQLDRRYAAPPQPRPTYSVQGYTISIHATDAHSSYWPATSTSSSAGRERKAEGVTTWYEEADNVTHKSVRSWKTKCGQALARLLDLSENADKEPWVLADWPKGYKMFVCHRNERSGEDSQYCFVAGSTFLDKRKFKTSKEFSKHLAWLCRLRDARTLVCACKHCQTRFGRDGLDHSYISVVAGGGPPSAPLLMPTRLSPGPSPSSASASFIASLPPDSFYSLPPDNSSSSSSTMAKLQRPTQKPPSSLRHSVSLADISIPPPSPPKLPEQSLQWSGDAVSASTTAGLQALPATVSPPASAMRHAFISATSLGPPPSASPSGYSSVPILFNPIPPASTSMPLVPEANSAIVSPVKRPASAPSAARKTPTSRMLGKRKRPSDGEESYVSASDTDALVARVRAVSVSADGGETSNAENVDLLPPGLARGRPRRKAAPTNLSVKDPLADVEMEHSQGSNGNAGNGKKGKAKEIESYTGPYIKPERDEELSHYAFPFRLDELAWYILPQPIKHPDDASLTITHWPVLIPQRVLSTKVTVLRRPLSELGQQQNYEAALAPGLKTEKYYRYLLALLGLDGEEVVCTNAELAPWLVQPFNPQLLSIPPLASKQPRTPNFPVPATLTDLEYAEHALVVWQSAHQRALRIASSYACAARYFDKTAKNVLKPSKERLASPEYRRKKKNVRLNQMRTPSLYQCLWYGAERLWCGELVRLAGCWAVADDGTARLELIYSEQDKADSKSAHKAKDNGDRLVPFENARVSIEARGKPAFFKIVRIQRHPATFEVTLSGEVFELIDGKHRDGHKAQASSLSKGNSSINFFTAMPDEVPMTEYYEAKYFPPAPSGKAFQRLKQLDGKQGDLYTIPVSMVAGRYYMRDTFWAGDTDARIKKNVSALSGKRYRIETVSKPTEWDMNRATTLKDAEYGEEDEAAAQLAKQDRYRTPAIPA